MTQPAMMPLVRKEARALWPLLAGSAAACLAAGLSDQPQLVMPGRASYFVGAAALSAMAIGHEYTYGTLPALLSLPIDRRRLLAAKLLAVLPMLIALAPLALMIGPGGPHFERVTVTGSLSLMTAVALAPLLTMICRSPLAGAVFALGLTGFFQIASIGLVIGYLKLGGTIAGWELSEVVDAVLGGLLIATSVLAAAAGWRMFITLEAIDGRGADVTWPRWLRSAMVLDEMAHVMPARRSAPLWLLVKKELRLQQMSVAVAAINVLIWLSALGVVGKSSESDGVLAALALLYGALIALLIGALASAEERHLGTLAWQTLLPVAAWWQFAVKTAVALALSLLLAFALPLLLARGELAVTWLHAAAVLLLTIGSLFVSSRCDSGLKAMAVAAPVLFVVAALVGWSIDFARVGPGMALTAIAGLAALALRFAFLNHRTARS
jgi:hypothetical protein